MHESICSMHEVEVRVHEGTCSNARWCVLECSESVYQMHEGVGSITRLCGLKLYEARGWALECTRCRLECSNVWAQIQIVRGKTVRVAGMHGV
jgi:hypothetical protein